MSTVKVVKLTTGEELVAGYAVKGEKVELKNPARFIFQPPEGIAMMPWVPLSKTKTFEIDAKLVMFTSDVEEEIYNAYQERFGSGIVLSSGKVPPTLKISD